jgi:hypothetical protein
MTPMRTFAPVKIRVASYTAAGAAVQPRWPGYSAAGGRIQPNRHRTVIRAPRLYLRGRAYNKIGAHSPLFAPQDQSRLLAVPEAVIVTAARKRLGTGVRDGGQKVGLLGYRTGANGAVGAGCADKKR